MSQPASTFPITPLAPFGVEIELNLDAPLSRADQQTFRELFFQHHLLIIRNQRLTIEDQVRVMAYLGKVLEAQGEYRSISSDGNLGAQALGFHSDLSFTEHPFKAISLHATEVVDGQSCTWFASGTRALRQLPEPLRQQIEHRDALAMISVQQSERRVQYDPPAILPQISRPAIMPHPQTGEPILYISALQTARIEGLPEDQSESLIQSLFDHLYHDDNIYEHRWHNGDLVIWDNLALQHARPDLTDCIPRTLQRVVVAEKSFFELCPQFSLDDPRIKSWAAGEALNL